MLKNFTLNITFTKIINRATKLIQRTQKAAPLISSATVGKTMPIIRVEMWEGRSLDQKRELVGVLTKEMARIAKCTADSVYVVIEEVKKENWGVSGQLCSEIYPD